MDKGFRGLVMRAFEYQDKNDQLRAAFLMGIATEKLWKSAAAEMKKKHWTEIKAELVKLRKPWNGEIEIAHAAVKDVVCKVLQKHGVYPYPELVHGMLGHNSFQTAGIVPDYVGDSGMHRESSMQVKSEETMGGPSNRWEVGHLKLRVDQVEKMLQFLKDGKHQDLTMEMHKTGDDLWTVINWN